MCSNNAIERISDPRHAFCVAEIAPESEIRSWLTFALSMKIEITEGDLLDQNVDFIVNAWNRNLIPWWLLIPQGVSGAIKRRAGIAPFKELRQFGVLPLGGAALTSAGRLKYKGIIHVAGIGHTWLPSEHSIRSSVTNALSVAMKAGAKSIAFPIIGSGTGGARSEQSLEWMREAATQSDFKGKILFVKYRK